MHDFVIPLAWPNAYVYGAGGWYDPMMTLLGMAKDGKYRVGHSAVLLINSKNGKVHYFDFGRYHTPLGFGRVRNEDTDHEIKVDSKAKISDNRIDNIEEILLEISSNNATHGQGVMYASVLEVVNFEAGFAYAKKIQAKGSVAYGPFVQDGTNCSRFVASVMRASTASIIKRFRLKFPICLSPSPKRNVSIANSAIYKMENNICNLVNRNKIKSYLLSIER